MNPEASINVTQLLIALMSGVALLLWSLGLVRTSMKKAYGGKLTYFVSHRFTGVLSSFWLGILITLVLQSSTAVALLSASLGVVGRSGLAMLLGADVGTTLVAFVLSFDLSLLGPIFILIGVFIKFKVYDKKLSSLAEAMIGVGLMLLSLTLIRSISAPLQESALFMEMLASLSSESLIAILFAAVITFALHSSIVMILLLVGLVSAGILTSEAGLLFVLGTNIGSSFIPVYAFRNDDNSKRVAPLGNLLLRGIGALALVPFVPYFNNLLTELGGSLGFQLVIFHFVFNFAVAAIGLSMLKPLISWIEAFFPQRLDKAAVSPKYLTKDDNSAPMAALSNVVRDTLTMGELLEDMLKEFHLALTKHQDKFEKKMHQSEDLIDDFHEQIRDYLLELNSQEMSETERFHCSDLLMFIENLEHASDTLDRSMVKLIKQKYNQSIVFKSNELEALDTCMNLVFKVIPLSFQLIMSRDLESARGLIRAKHSFIDTHQRYLHTQMNSLATRKNVNPVAQSLFIDLMRDIRRLHSHYTAVAFPILSRAGELQLLGQKGSSEILSGQQKE
ncbi:MAG: Na/Pi cotransporter family protein [Gammaproteobacteria bacterium]